MNKNLASSLLFISISSVFFSAFIHADEIRPGDPVTVVKKFDGIVIGPDGDKFKVYYTDPNGENPFVESFSGQEVELIRDDKRARKAIRRGKEAQSVDVAAVQFKLMRTLSEIRKNLPRVEDPALKQMLNLANLTTIRPDKPNAMIELNKELLSFAQQIQDKEVRMYWTVFYTINLAYLEEATAKMKNDFACSTKKPDQTKDPRCSGELNP